MPDDKSKVGAPARSLVAADDDEVRNFARKFTITPDQVRELIKKYGNSCEKLEAEAAKLKTYLSFPEAG